MVDLTEDSPASQKALMEKFGRTSKEFQNQSILRNSTFFKFVSKAFFPKFLEGLTRFYHLESNVLTSLSYHKINKALKILKVFEIILKKMQSGKLSMKGANKLLKKQSNIFTSKLDEPLSGQTDLATLQIDFLEALGVDFKTQSQVLQIRELADIGFAMRLVRVLDNLLDLKNFVSASLDWESDYFKRRFQGVEELTIQHHQKQVVQSIFDSACFDLKVQFSSQPHIYLVKSQLYDVRFFPFRKLKR